MCVLSVLAFCEEFYQFVPIVDTTNFEGWFSEFNEALLINESKVNE